MDEAPKIIVGGLAITGSASVSYAENGTDPVATYTDLAGPNADSSARWMTLGGADAGDFTFTGGVLSFRSSPNYEAPADADMDNVYMVTLTARDSEGTQPHAQRCGEGHGREDTTTPVTDGTLLDRYDVDDSGRIDKDELANGVFDYNIERTLDKADLVDLIFSYEIG